MVKADADISIEVIRVIKSIHNQKKSHHVYQPISIAADLECYDDLLIASHPKKHLY